MTNNDYIRGFFDGEGSITIYKGRGYAGPEVKLTNTCLPILVSIKEQLEAQGFHPHLLEKKDRRSPSYKTLYHIRLTRWTEIIRFYREIGTEHPDKQARFEKVIALDSVRRYRNPSGGKKATIKAVEQMLKHSERMV